MNAIPTQPVTVNELLTCLLKCDELLKRMSTSPVQYNTAILFSILQSINTYVDMDSVF